MSRMKIEPTEADTSNGIYKYTINITSDNYMWIETNENNSNKKLSIDLSLGNAVIDKGDFSKQWSDIKKQLAYDIYNLGDIKVPLRPGINQEDPQSNPKHERDILAERISLIKELNKEYEKLNKVMGGCS